MAFAPIPRIQAACERIVAPPQKRGERGHRSDPAEPTETRRVLPQRYDRIGTHAHTAVGVAYIQALAHILQRSAKILDRLRVDVHIDPVDLASTRHALLRLDLRSPHFLSMQIMVLARFVAFLSHLL
jgi:hypothetical protein